MCVFLVVYMSCIGMLLYEFELPVWQQEVASDSGFAGSMGYAPHVVMMWPHDTLQQAWLPVVDCYARLPV
jgi:hypothetical protein